MNRPKILVTGATGRTGAAVVSELLKGGYPVRAMVRREDARAAALRAKGVDIAVAEITDMERVFAAMRGHANGREVRRVGEEARIYDRECDIGQHCEEVIGKPVLTRQEGRMCRSCEPLA